MSDKFQEPLYCAMYHEYDRVLTLIKKDSTLNIFQRNAAGFIRESISKTHYKYCVPENPNFRNR